jgi:predicted RNase H-like nuclease (RuvC/YqgF family)|tara:strand:+ start:684 stop:1151 length:468 start_codon:yes stop_codon:yes gene_type:complete
LKNENSTLKESISSYEKHIDQLEKQTKTWKVEFNDKENKIQLLTERINQVQDRDVELERIFDYAYDLTMIHFVYKEVEGDKIDKKLADIINHADKNSKSSMNKAKLLFVRESEGVYTYCKKKVFIKRTDEDRLIIRVGGGYMSLEEFIDTFNPFQ